LNQVERLVALHAEKRIRRGVHHRIPDLTDDVAAFISAHDDGRKRFIWTNPADAFLQSIAHCCSETLAIHAAAS